MAPKIIILFPGGAFGSTLEYCIRKFSAEFETIHASIQPDGSMHGFLKQAHIIYQNDFDKIKNSYQNIFSLVYPNHSNTTVEELVNYFKSCINNKKVIFVTLDNEEAVEKNELFAFYKIPNKLEVQCKLENIRKWNYEHNTVYDMQRWELRECLSLLYEDYVPMLAQAKQLSKKEWLNLNPQNILDSFDETIKKIFSYLNLTLDDEQGLKEFADIWLSKQQYILDKHKTLQTVFENIIQNTDYKWNNLDIVSEALLQYKLKKHGILLKCFNLNNFPTSTRELQKCFE